jgi:hypothetical protein
MGHASILSCFPKFCSTPRPPKFNPFKTVFRAEEVACYVTRCTTPKEKPGWLKIFQNKGKKHRFLCDAHSNEYKSELKEPIEIILS